MAPHVVAIVSSREQEADPVTRMTSDVNAMLLTTAVFALICSFVGMISNLLTLLALPASSKAKSTATVFVLNLAVAEFLFSTITLPLTAAQYIHIYKYNSTLLTDDHCAVFTTVRYALSQAEIQSVLAIALIRAIAVGMPKLYIFIKRRSISLAYVAFIWIYSFAIKIPTALGELVQDRFGSYDFNNKTLECDVSTDARITREVFLVIEIIIPIAAIASCYFFIFFKVRQNSKQMHASLRTSHGRQYYKNRRLYGQLFRRDRRVARSIFIVFLIMLICAIPVGVTHRGTIAVDYPELFFSLHILYWLQFSINPVVYAIMNENYRDAFYDFLHKIFGTFLKKSNGLPMSFKSSNFQTTPIPLLSDSTFKWQIIPSKSKTKLSS